MMGFKTVRRSVPARRRRVQSAPVATGFFGLLAKLAGASNQLNRTRRRK